MFAFIQAWSGQSGSGFVPHCGSADADAFGATLDEGAADATAVVADAEAAAVVAALALAVALAGGSADALALAVVAVVADAEAAPPEDACSDLVHATKAAIEIAETRRERTCMPVSLPETRVSIRDSFSAVSTVAPSTSSVVVR
jgi:hypothetical protein